MKTEPEYKPVCRDCGDQIDGISYNGRCGSCNQQARREEYADYQRSQVTMGVQDDE